MRSQHLNIDRSLLFRRFGLTQVPESGGNVEVLAAHGLDGASLAEAMQQTLSAMTA